MANDQFVEFKNVKKVYPGGKVALRDVSLTLPQGEIVETGEGNFLQEIRVGEPFTANVSCDVILKDDIVIAINPKA